MYREFKARIYLIKSDTARIELGSSGFSVADAFFMVDAVVIWDRQGMFRIFPNSIIRNLFIQYEATRNLKAKYPRMTPLTDSLALSWDQGTDILPAVVKHLLAASKECDGLDDPDTTADTAGEDQAE